jgi:PhnB protein
MKNSIVFEFSVDKENKVINVEREFAAPLAKVWAAWTRSEILDQWWAPKPWQARTKSMDFREGGHWLYAMVGPDGSIQWCRADYKSIKAMKSFTGLDAFCDESGNINKDFPIPLWNVHFTDHSDSTMVKIEIVYNEVADLEKYMEMGFREGFTAALENLDAILES